MICASGFLAWNLTDVLTAFRRVETGFTGAALALALLLYLVYRSPSARPQDAVRPDSPAEVEARLAAAQEAG